MHRMYLIVALLLCSNAYAEIPTPSPTCNGPILPYLSTEVFSSSDTYIPNEPFSVSLIRTDGEDWPTTPTVFNWVIDLDDEREIFSGEQSIEVVIPPPGPNIVEIHGSAEGDGIRPECPHWESQYTAINVRRNDTPPSPTPSPTCANVLALDCHAGVYPPHNSIINSTSVSLSYPCLRGSQGHIGEFINIGSETGEPVTVWFQPGTCGNVSVSGLQYDTEYTWSYSPLANDICSIKTCSVKFRTGPAPTPSLTPSPTPVPGNSWILKETETIITPTQTPRLP